ncbi:MAG TPA: PAS domain S-box protein [Cytophagaceae bacterium]
MNNEIEGVSSLISELKDHVQFLNNKEILGKAIANRDWDMAQECLRKIYSYQLFDSVEKFAKCEEGAYRIASLDFSKHVPWDDSNHCANYFAKTLNLIMEELSIKVFPCQAEIIDLISDIVIVTDMNWNIIAINKKFQTHCGYSLSEVEDKHISQIFALNTLELNIKNGFTIKDLSVQFKGKDGIIPVLLNVNEVKGFKNLTHNFTFIGKLV